MVIQTTFNSHSKNEYGLKMNPLKGDFGVHAGDFLGFVVHKKKHKNKPKQDKGYTQFNPSVV